VRVFVVILVLILILFPQTAFSSVDIGPVLTHNLPPTHRIIPAPIYAVEFMARAPRFSEVLKKHKSNKPLHYDERLAKILRQTQSEGNTNITWKSDKQVFGKIEYWDFPCKSNGKLYDDCDGFAIWKMRRLIELGLPSTPLLFTLAFDETKSFHAVLVVVTDAGDFVLDNRQTTIMTVEEMIKLGYNFTHRVARGDAFAGQWVEFKPIYPLPPTRAETTESTGAVNPLCPAQ